MAGPDESDSSSDWDSSSDTSEEGGYFEYDSELADSEEEGENEEWHSPYPN